MKSFLVFFAILGVAFAVDYTGAKVYRVVPQTVHHISLLRALHSVDEYDFWTLGTKIGRPVDIMVAQVGDEFFIELCEKYGLEYEVFIDDVQELINGQKSLEPKSPIKNAKMSWDQYYTVDEIYDWMDQLVELYPTLVSITVAGESFEGRPIKVLKISFGEDKKAVYIEGGIHAREWISPATTNFIINELLTSEDANMRKIAESFDWYIVPVANPDGYAFTHTENRLWRKNRSPNVECLGTDGNRNWDVYWGTAGTSTNECDETYGGGNAASEAETIHLSNVIDSIGSRLDVFLSFHSYGNMLLMPYGHTTDHLDNYDDVLLIGQAAAEALSLVDGTEYAVGNTAETIYSHSGGTMDWVKLNYQPPIAFTYELRGSPGGFILPPEFISINCEEVLMSFLTIFNEGDRRGLITLT